MTRMFATDSSQSRRGYRRKLDGELCASALGITDMNLPAVGVDRLFDQREPEAGPFLFGGEKRCEDLLAFVFGDARPVVGDDDLRGRTVHRELDLHAPALRCRLNPVADEVEDRAFQLIGV